MSIGKFEKHIDNIVFSLSYHIHGIHGSGWDFLHTDILLPHPKTLFLFSFYIQILFL